MSGLRTPAMRRIGQGGSRTIVAASEQTTSLWVVPSGRIGTYLRMPIRGSWMVEYVHTPSMRMQKLYLIAAVPGSMMSEGMSYIVNRLFFGLRETHA